MTQDILSEMDSDEVNSISDTVESDQIANLIRTTYYDLVELEELPSADTLLNLTGLADTNTPTHMRMPDGVRRLDWIKYNKIESGDTDPDYQDIVAMDPKRFMDYILSRNLDDTCIDSITDFSGEVLLIRNDQAPQFWTSFDDTYIVFDSYDNTVESTLQSSKTTCYGSQESTFTLADTFIPDLPSHFFPRLLAEAKAKAFVLFKQVTNSKEERNARKHQIKWQRTKKRTGEGFSYWAQGR